MKPIWEDIRAVLYGLINGGKGVTQKVITNGSSNDTKILENTDYVLPAINIVNQGTVPIRWGYGVANQLLPAGTPVTIRWKNPRLMMLVYNDLGNAGVEINIFS